MRRFILLLLLSTLVFGWGKTGHRIVGKIAQEQLNEKAREAVVELLGHGDLSRVANWADEIKSDPDMRYANNWHYCTIPPGGDLEPGTEGGKLAEKIREFSAVLASRDATREERVFALKFLVHLVGDAHQPLHVGNGTDRGGNDVKVRWFGDSTNLHHVWDSEIIDYEQLSYTEYAHYLMLTLTPQQVRKWQKASLEDILEESQSFHSQVYDVGEGDLGWSYIYANSPVVENRLLRGGVRLAGILNDIYGGR